MYVFLSDGVFSARSPNGEECPLDLQKMQERALKTAVLKGWPIEAGEPNLIDNAYFLKAAAKKDGFLDVLLASGFTVRLPRKDGKISLFNSLARQLENPTQWYMASWREYHEEKFPEKVRQLEDDSSKARVKDAKSYCSSLEGDFLDGLVRFHCKFSPNSSHQIQGAKNLSKDPTKSLLSRIQQIIMKLRSDKEAWRREICQDTADILTTAISSLSESDRHSRTKIMEFLCDKKLDLAQPADQNVRLAVAAVHIAYNTVISEAVCAGDSWLCDWMAYQEQTDSLFLQDYLDLLSPFNSSERPILGAGANAMEENQNKSEDKGFVLDSLNWNRIGEIIGGDDYIRTCSAWRTAHAAKQEKEKDARLEFNEYIEKCVTTGIFDVSYELWLKRLDKFVEKGPPIGIFVKNSIKELATSGIEELLKAITIAGVETIENWEEREQIKAIVRCGYDWSKIVWSIKKLHTIQGRVVSALDL